MEGVLKMTCTGFLFWMECVAPAPPRTTVVSCPPLVQWEEGLQKRAAAELEALPPNSALRALTARAIKQRDIIRRCKGGELRK